MPQEKLGTSIKNSNVFELSILQVRILFKMAFASKTEIGMSFTTAPI